MYAGPHVLPTPAPLPGWSESYCDVDRLAALLLKGHPVVVLEGRAEIGPRALGHRSLLAMPESGMQDRLNQIKGRELWRPVAPVVLESEAHKYFKPGTPDPYMLFDHKTLPVVRAQLPAILHMDGTARIQTVNAQQDPLMYTLLTHIKETGRPAVLCNTSANLNGSGFFPSAAEAMRWGKVDYVWDEGTLYTKES